MQHDHYSKGEVLEIFVSYFLLTAFSVSIIVLGPFLTVVVGRIKIKNLGTTLNKIRGIFLPEILPDHRTGNRNPGGNYFEQIFILLLLPLSFLTSSLNYHLYFDVKPITLKNPPGQGFVPNLNHPSLLPLQIFLISIIRTS